MQQECYIWKNQDGFGTATTADKTGDPWYECSFSGLKKFKRIPG